MAFFDTNMLTETPDVPKYKSVDLGKSQQTAINSNLANWDTISQLTTKANSLATDQLMAGIEKLSPGAASSRAQTQSVINSRLRGELSDDVSQSVARSAASTAMAGGYGGSGMARNLTLRDLGLTSAEMQTLGINENTSWQSLMKSMTPSYDFTSLLITPTQQWQTDYTNAVNQWNVDWLSNQMEAYTNNLHNPAISFLNTANSVLGAAVSMYGGNGSNMTNQSQVSGGSWGTTSSNGGWGSTSSSGSTEGMSGEYPSMSWE